MESSIIITVLFICSVNILHVQRYTESIVLDCCDIVFILV